MEGIDGVTSDTTQVGGRSCAARSCASCSKHQHSASRASTQARHSYTVDEVLFNRECVPAAAVCRAVLLHL